MERSDSLSSTGSSSRSGSGAVGPFAYQTRLLERTSSRSGTGSLSRAASVSRTGGILASPTGNGTATRRWTPTHRVANSLDTVRGKWEERSKADTLDESRTLPTVHAEQRTRTLSMTPSSSANGSPDPATRVQSTDRFSAHFPSRDGIADIQQTTPPALKRHTIPAPIIASPLSPNTTGVTVESPDSPPYSFSTPTPQRIRLPVSTPLQSSSVSALMHLSNYVVPASPESPSASVASRVRRANTLDSINPSNTGSSVSSDQSSSSSGPSRISRVWPPEQTPAPAPKRRPTSLYGGQYSMPPSPEKPRTRTTSSVTLGRASSLSPDKPSNSSVTPSSASTASSVMTPAPYRSSYMANKKASAYGESLTTGYRLGRHLPRIASGDAPEDWVDETKVEEKLPPPQDRSSRREERLRTRDWEPPSPEKIREPELVVPGVTDAGDVAGIPGRLRLSRDLAPTTPTSPLPSSRLTRGLWADVQRHLLQAYEYLCHVGEAQQWIEGCLGEELSFGVVEMEEGLRNGVVLARLVRVFKGEGAVRRIYDVRDDMACCHQCCNRYTRRRNLTSDIPTTSTTSSPLCGMSVFQRYARFLAMFLTYSDTLLGFHLRTDRFIREEELSESNLLYSRLEVCHSSSTRLLATHSRLSLVICLRVVD